MVKNWTLMWFRQDLRVLDNTALSACCNYAAENDSGVIAIVYLTPCQWQCHRKSLWQIDLILRQLQTLRTSLATFNIGLIVRTVSDFAEQASDLLQLSSQLNVENIFANLEYPINEVMRDQFVTQQASALGLTMHWYDDSNVVAPKRIVTDKGLSYKVFTPFFKRWLAMIEIAGLNLSAMPEVMPISSNDIAKTLSNTDENITIADIYHNYLVSKPALDRQLQQVLQLGEKLYPAHKYSAQNRLDDFLRHDISDYDTTRDVPSLNNNLGATSRLSPYLAIGAISPRQCYLKAMQLLQSKQGRGFEKHIMRWLSELGWRDFYYDVMVNRPDIVKGAAFLPDLDKAVTWRYDKADFEAWSQGKTGVPLVDAAMRSLNATGFMHNRLRMVVAMYLSKNLLVDWRWGEAYFMQHLVDGDFASNNGGWQWSASVGTDAQPYFRVMNPFNQAATHDPEAKFIKHWLPELEKLPASIINNEQKLQTYLEQHPTILYPKLAMPTKLSRAMAIESFKKPSN